MGATQLWQLREHIAVLDWQINCAACEGVYAQRIVLEVCTEDTLSTFMHENGPTVTSALAPSLNGPSGLEVVARRWHQPTRTRWLKRAFLQRQTCCATVRAVTRLHSTCALNSV